MYMVQLPPVQNFTPFCSTASRFSGTDHFETSAPNDPKMTFNTKRSRHPTCVCYNYPRVPIYTCYNYPRVPNFTPFHSTTSCFRVTGHFKIRTLNEPKMTLNTKKSKGPHIHVTTTPPSPKFYPAALYDYMFLSNRPF